MFGWFYGISTVVYHCRTEKIDPTVIKVEERKKLCLTTKRFIYNYHAWVVAGRKKESMETETTALTSNK